MLFLLEKSLNALNLLGSQQFLVMYVRESRLHTH